jgi:hypothetical protein
MKSTGKWTQKIAGLAAASAIAFTAFAPIAAQADGYGNRSGYHQQAQLQQNKNTLRSVAIGSAVLGLLGLANHNNGLAIIGTAGAAIAGSQYEQDRQQHSADQSQRDNRWYHRWNNNGDNRSNNRY